MYQQILVAVDGSETSVRALNAALQLARGGASRDWCSAVSPNVFCASRSVQY